jgi:hypothetical protein
MSADAGWEIAGWAWEKRDQILGLLSELRDWFRGGKKDDAQQRPGILILGPGGTGKSTLGRILSGEYDLLLDLPGEYRESISAEEYELPGDPKIEILVPPGQYHRREATWTQLLADLSAGRFRGIILLNAYGYHTLGQIDFRGTALYKERGKSGFLPAYLEERRSDELAVLKKLSDAACSTRGSLWILSLISKQDLWWPRRSEVERHYRAGDYGTMIGELQTHLGQLRFRHEFSFASLVISNFMAGRDVTLSRNAAGYDQNLQVASLRRLFETVAALKQWEGTE